MRNLRLVVAALTVLPLLFVGGTETTATATATATVRHVASVAVSVSPRVVVPRETTHVTGAFPLGHRRVDLQRYAHGHWVRVTSVHSTARGRFNIAFHAPSARTAYRVYAARALKRTSSGTTVYRAAKSRTVTISPVRPTASLSLLAAPVAQSPSGRADLTAGVATFRPARPGHKVVVQSYSSAGWVTAASGVQRSNGTYAVKVSARTTSGALIAYRAVTWPATGVPSVASPGTRSAGYRLAWSDEFTGSALDPAKWQIRGVGAHPAQRQCARPAEANASVASGVARLSVVSDPAPDPNASCPKGQYTNGMIGTDQTYTFRYGFAAARIKFQAGRGQHGAFWLQAPSPGAEIDVAEFFGAHRSRGGLGTFVYWPGAGGKQLSVGAELTGSNRVLGAGHEWSDTYHVFSVEWTPTRYVFRVDGDPVFQTTQGVSRVPESLILSLLTSDWELPALDRSTLPSSMSVDWVRVWQA